MSTECRLLHGLYSPLLSVLPLSAQSSYDSVARSQLMQYPTMEARDLYKLLYQAASGNEPLMTNTAGVGLSLLHEPESVQALRVNRCLMF